jgi:hypothetical protein
MRAARISPEVILALSATHGRGRVFLDYQHNCMAVDFIRHKCMILGHFSGLARSRWLAVSLLHDSFDAISFTFGIH